jgi:hypothetical protein
MLFEENFAEVRASVAEALQRPASARQRTDLTNVLAWAMAHDGAAAAAIPIAEAALAEGSGVSPSERALLRGTLGVAFVLANRPADAIPALEEAIEAAGPARAVPSRAYYLGEAFRALGRTEEARAAYTRCIHAQSRGRWATRASIARESVGVAYR